MLVIIRGAGDIASGIALRLYRAGMRLVLTDLPVPTAVRRTVCFSEAIRLGEVQVEGITGRLAHSAQEALEWTKQGIVPVLADPEGKCIEELKPDAVVAVGPGFTAGVDCHAAVETMRGHTLGRVLYTGSPIPNTGVPGNIGGYTVERVLRAPASGIFKPCLEIGAMVKAGDVAAMVGETPMYCTIDGCLRGLLQEGIEVFEGMKSGDIDPRCKPDHCLCASDKALAVGGGVLEALLHLTQVLEE